MEKKLQLKKDSFLPLYYQIKKRIEQKVNSGQWKVGEVIPSEEELCRTYRVSRGTVRQAVSELVNEGLLVRRQGSGTYVASRLGKNKNIKIRRRTIGYIVSYLRDSFGAGILLGISDVVHKAGYNCVFANSRNLTELQRREIARFRECGVEGIIIFLADGSVSDSTMAQMIAEGYPFVLVDRYLKDLETNYVVSDNLSGGYQATRYLIELGHKRIGLIISPIHSSTCTEDRFNGYLQALKEFNIPFDDSLVKVITMKGATSPKKIHGQAYTMIHYDLEAIESFLVRKDRPTAIFTVNDLIALDTLKVAKKLHLNIPQDLSIVGYDNIDIVTHLEVPLTTIHQAKYEMGMEAARILIEKIKQKDNTFKKVILPTQLLIRKSCTR